MMVGFLPIFLYCLAFNNLINAYSFSASALVGQSWKPADHDFGIWAGANNITAQVLLSTTAGKKPENFSGDPIIEFGFISNGQQRSYTLGVFIGANASITSYDMVVVWSANGDHPVDEHASLHLTADSGLVLKDRGGHRIWATNTSGSSVSSMNLTCEGNIILVNENGSVVWQSYDHPTDTWLPWQTLHPSQRLTSRASSVNFSRGLFYASLYEHGIHTFVDSDPPVRYSSVRSLNDSCNGFFSIAMHPIPHKLTYLRLESNGNLNQYIYDVREDLLSNVLQVEGGNCCNCSCVAASFHYKQNHSSCNCSLQSQLFALMQFDLRRDYKSTSFIKVQTQNDSTPQSGQKSSIVISNLLPPLLVGLLVVITFCTVLIYYMRLLRSIKDKCTSDVVIDTITRFSYETLRLAAHDFNKRLGHGGFGSVFEGTLGDGKQVAVKCLDSVEQGRKEFLAEVNTIGTLHHFNLVKLLGFCEEGSHRLLVYEYMVNGSLDKWIFDTDLAQTLTWSLRKKIIYGIAKGLEYLHENCNQNVIHFDIKPQNILLDGDFTVKISDFGLAKLVNRDESQVLTVIRGTPGYIAPELLTGESISVKADVYSFGILVLEIVCGRKNISRLEEDLLTNLVRIKAYNGKLVELVDKRTADMQLQKEEVVNMMQVGIWCLQPHAMRPTMSMVVNVLQDHTNMDFTHLTNNEAVAVPGDVRVTLSSFTTISVLSGPR